MNFNINVFEKKVMKKMFVLFTVLSLVGSFSLIPKAFADGNVLPGHKF